MQHRAFFSFCLRSQGPSALLVLLILLLCIAGCKATPPNDYTGTLILTYSRTFPSFSVTGDIDLEIYKSGDVFFSQPEQVSYSGESEIAGEVKINETGTITITSLEGAWVVRNGVEYLEVHCNTLIDGTQTTWGWDDERGWIQAAEIPFSVEDPAKPPLLFDVASALVGNGASVGVTAPAFGGSVTYRWTLVLFPSLVQQ